MFYRGFPRIRRLVHKFDDFFSFLFMSTYVLVVSYINRLLLTSSFILCQIYAQISTLWKKVSFVTDFGAFLAVCQKYGFLGKLRYQVWPELKNITVFLFSIVSTCRMNTSIWLVWMFCANVGNETSHIAIYLHFCGFGELILLVYMFPIQYIFILRLFVMCWSKRPLVLNVFDAFLADIRSVSDLGWAVIFLVFESLCCSQFVFLTV